MGCARWTGMVALPEGDGVDGPKLCVSVVPPEDVPSAQPSWEKVCA